MTKEDLNEKIIKAKINNVIFYKKKNGEDPLSELKTKYQISCLTLDELEKEINNQEKYEEFIDNLGKFVYRNNTYIYFIYRKTIDIISFINDNHEKYNSEDLSKKEKYIIDCVSETLKKPSSLKADFKSQYELDQKMFLDQPLLFDTGIDFESITRHNYVNALRINMLYENNDRLDISEDLKNDIYFLYTTNLLLKRYPQIYNYSLLNETSNIIESYSIGAFTDKKDYRFYQRYANKTLKNIEKRKDEMKYNKKIHYKR